MAHGTFHDPEFDIDTFRAEVSKWAKAGSKRLMIEWSTGPGPTVVYFPAGDRSVAVAWRVHVPSASYNEQYADFLDYRLMPRLREIGQGLGMDMRIACVDQQPIQVMRMRRREIEHAQLLVTGSPHELAAAQS